MSVLCISIRIEAEIRLSFKTSVHVILMELTSSTTIYWRLSHESLNYLLSSSVDTQHIPPLTLAADSKKIPTYLVHLLCMY